MPPSRCQSETLRLSPGPSVFGGRTTRLRGDELHVVGEELNHQGDRGRAVEQVEEGVVPRQAVAHLPEAAVVQALGGLALGVEAVAGGLEARPQVVGQGTRHDENPSRSKLCRCSSVRGVKSMATMDSSVMEVVKRAGRYSLSPVVPCRRASTRRSPCGDSGRSRPFGVLHEKQAVLGEDPRTAGGGEQDPAQGPAVVQRPVRRVEVDHVEAPGLGGELPERGLGAAPQQLQVVDAPTLHEPAQDPRAGGGRAPRRSPGAPRL